MSIRIALSDPPEFYTNLDVISGRIVLYLSRPEQVGAITVKLEGESRTALSVPYSVISSETGMSNQARNNQGGGIAQENHKILYKVAQVFPDDSIPAHAVPVTLPQGQHEFPFRFKVPFNNACSDPTAMAKIGGLAGAGGFAAGPSLFGLGGIRVMNGSKQLMYPHVTKTLPPSFTGFPGMAEIRYYVKVTIQRPGLFKENWRYQLGLKFLPIEPPRSKQTSQEAFARRPFTFRPRSPLPGAKKKGGLFGSKSKAGSSSTASLADDAASPSPTDPNGLQAGLAPSIEMSARLPHPSILTCNQPLPLRLLARKLVPSKELVYLISLQVDLVGATRIRSQDLEHTETTRWVVVSRTGLSVPLCGADSPVGAETVVPDSLWSAITLPDTVMPSFVTCNLGREYRLELKLGLSWGLPPSGSSAFNKKARTPALQPQSIFLPLNFSLVEVFSGMTPPKALIEAMAKPNRRRPSAAASSAAGQDRPPRRQSMYAVPVSASSESSSSAAPPLPVRPAAAQRPSASHDVLYPPQLAPGQTAPPYDDAPPSYDEAMAGEVTGPVFPPGQSRPAYSGVTNENAPSSIPEKN